MKSFEHSQVQELAMSDPNSIANMSLDTARKILTRISPRLMGCIPCDRPFESIQASSDEVLSRESGHER